MKMGLTKLAVQQGSIITPCTHVQQGYAFSSGGGGGGVSMYNISPPKFWNRLLSSFFHGSKKKLSESKHSLTTQAIFIVLIFSYYTNYGTKGPPPHTYVVLMTHRAG